MEPSSDETVKPTSKNLRLGEVLFYNLFKKVEFLEKNPVLFYILIFNKLFVFLVCLTNCFEDDIHLPRELEPQ